MLKSTTVPLRRRGLATIKLALVLVAAYIASTYRPITWPVTPPQHVQAR